jgi:hypothetical protein
MRALQRVPVMLTHSPASSPCLTWTRRSSPRVTVRLSHLDRNALYLTETAAQPLQFAMEDRRDQRCQGVPRS